MTKTWAILLNSAALGTLSLSSISQAWVFHPLPLSTTFCRTRTSTGNTNVLRSEPASSQEGGNNFDAHDDENIVYRSESMPFSYARLRTHGEALLASLETGRAGAVVETEEQAKLRRKLAAEIDSGEYYVPPDVLEEYGEQEQEEAKYDNDDPDAIDVETLGSWTYRDLKSRFDYEWDPLDPNDSDPNVVEMNQPDIRYLTNPAVDEDGVEIGYSSMHGPSNPIDERTILGARDSYMIDEKTRDESMLKPLFPDPDDPEIAFNDDFVQYRRSRDIIETYVDPFLPGLEIPRHSAKWHGYPEPMCYEAKNFTNNRFTENPTDFYSLTPFRARQLAVEMARSKNAEWLPPSKSAEWHKAQRKPYEDYGTLVGSVRPGACDPEIVELIQPALDILGRCVELLSIDKVEMTEEDYQYIAEYREFEVDNDDDEDEDEEPRKTWVQPGPSERMIIRFYYNGLMMNKFGMERWTETLIADCSGIDASVIFETGFRRRDPHYDGGDGWNGPIM